MLKQLKDFINGHQILFDLILILILILFDMSVHQLNGGPDRLIHDPAVYRLLDKNYLPGDWYTDMAIQSGVYVFYAKLIGISHILHIPEELWRTLLYLLSLGTLYYAAIRIARLFTKNVLIVPIIAILHLIISTGANQPIWLYGPFIQVDGGLAPRSVGIALSFVALYLLARQSFFWSAAVLGIVTLIHVSNSFIVFSLFALVWLIQTIFEKRKTFKTDWQSIAKKFIIGGLIYLLAGGWFALYVASREKGLPADFTTEKFIWSWIYLRAPYMALPLVGKYWWIRLFTHVIAVLGGWLILHYKFHKPEQRRVLTTLGLVGLGAFGYFLLFYLVAFIWPWLPGFQFYSLRIIYLTYFIAYLFTALSLVIILYALINQLLSKIAIRSSIVSTSVVFILLCAFLFSFSNHFNGTFRKPKKENLTLSKWRLLDQTNVFSRYVPDNQKFRPFTYATFDYIYKHPEPVLAPVDWRTGTTYLPTVVSFKSFGFTKQGLAEWYERMNDVLRGRINTVFLEQKTTGVFKPADIIWRDSYSALTTDEVEALAQKYNFHLFLTYQTLSYPFEIVATDSDYTLYRLK